VPWRLDARPNEHQSGEEYANAAEQPTKVHEVRLEPQLGARRPLWLIHIAWPLAGVSWIIFLGEQMFDDIKRDRCCRRVWRVSSCLAGSSS
jgi:hypothetical protein